MTRMDCSEIHDLLQGYVDDELSATERASVDAHLEACPNCAAALAELRSLRSRIRAAGTFAMPAHLAGRARAAIGIASEDARKASWRRIAALAASHAAVGLLGAAVVWWALLQKDWNEDSAQNVVAAHVRSLMTQQLVQVASSDTHTVRPWFAGKVPFSPDVLDLATLGFPLAGGRVDHVLGRSAAALVYDRRKHRINVFIVPDEAGRISSTFRATRSGYNIVAWRQGGMAHFAVSDLNLGELAEFAAALRRPAAP